MMSSPQNKKSLRAVEFLLVIFVAFSSSVVTSIVVWLTPPRETVPNYITSILAQLSALAVLTYVLYRQGRSLKQLGLLFSWADIPTSLLLAFIGYIASRLLRYGTFYTFQHAAGITLDARPHNVRAFYAGAVIASLVYIVINPFKEELIARAFTISEMEFLSGSRLVAVLVSVALQTSYHLYQGLFPAWSYVPMFLLFSLYYVNWRRITPIILAHLYMDVWAWLDAALK